MAREAYLIIVNPSAANGKAVSRIGKIEGLLHAKKLDYSLLFTESPGHAISLARNAAGEKKYGTIVAAGGDGTVNEVINGMMEARGQGVEPPDLGVLPIGRGNDFAYGAGVPDSQAEAVDVLIKGEGYAMDVGKISGGLYPEGRCFGNGIGIGFDTIVGLESAKAKWAPGFFGYVYGALKTFLLFPSAPQIIMDYGDDRFEGESHQISIMNGRRMGGTFFMAPDSLNSDGAFDLCMAGKALTRGEMMKAIVQYTKGSQIHNSLFRLGRAERFRIEAPEGGLICHADGETITTDGTLLEIECIPSALKMRGIAR
jgi:diacylglycerol kinase (ATP)